MLFFFFGVICQSKETDRKVKFNRKAKNCPSKFVNKSIKNLGNTLKFYNVL